MSPTDTTPARLRILAVGVGGQGVLTVARFIGEAARETGHGVVVGQLHGMSQRGGSVECTVLVGGARSSFISAGQADVVLGLEPLEVWRALSKMSPQTKVVANQTRIVPSHLALSGTPYPSVEQMFDEVRSSVFSMHALDGQQLAQRVGASRTLNVVMLGALAGLDVLPFGRDALWGAVEQRSKARYLEHNRRAFALGIEAVG